MKYPEALTRNLTPYKVTLLQVPESWNVIMRKHWGVYAKLRKSWKEEFAVMAYRAKIPKSLDHVFLEATIYYPENRIRDADNCMVWKLTQDAMKDCGIISDDNPAIVTTLQPTLLVDPENPRTEITIWADAGGDALSRDNSGHGDEKPSAAEEGTRELLA